MIEGEIVKMNRGATSVRDFLLRGWRWLHGTDEKVSYTLTSALFLRALGVVYFVAFVSLAVQMLGLYGSQGILRIGWRDSHLVLRVFG
jgi:hypothetical protein